MMCWQSILTRNECVSVVKGELSGAEVRVMPSEGIQRGISVAGLTRDALYLWTGGQLRFYPPYSSLLAGGAERAPNVFTLADDPNEFVIVFGVNHEGSGKAAFLSFTVYGADIWNGVGGVTSDQYPMAEECLAGNRHARYVYTYKIGRRCDGKNCFRVPGSGL